MGVRIVPPTRREPIVSENDNPTLRMANFMEGISNTIADLPGTYPEIIPDISDISGPSSITENRNKINEILAAMRTAGLMV